MPSFLQPIRIEKDLLASGVDLYQLCFGALPIEFDPGLIIRPVLCPIRKPDRWMILRMQPGVVQQWRTRLLHSPLPCESLDSTARRRRRIKR